MLKTLFLQPHAPVQDQKIFALDQGRCKTPQFEHIPVLYSAKITGFQPPCSRINFITPLLFL